MTENEERQKEREKQAAEIAAWLCELRELIDHTGG
jgi:hypothetical protein